MKKTLFAVVLGALAVASTANANWYVQGDLGYSKTKIDGEGADLKESGFEPRISVGYKFQDFRLALDYTHYKNIKDSYNIDDVQGSTKTKIRGVGLSAIYDIPLGYDLQPYVGARLAVNHIKLTDNYTYNSGSTTYVGSDNYKETNLGYGAILGVTYPLATNLKLNASVEYNRLGEVDDADVDNYGAKVGLRYEF